MTTKHELFKEGEKFTKAISVNVFFKTKTKETVLIPDQLKSVLSGQMEPQ